MVRLVDPCKRQQPLNNGSSKNLTEKIRVSRQRSYGGWRWVIARPLFVIQLTYCNRMHKPVWACLQFLLHQQGFRRLADLPPLSSGGWRDALLHRPLHLSTPVHLMPSLYRLWCSSLLTLHRLGSIWYSAMYQQRVRRRRSNTWKASFCWRARRWWLHSGSSRSVHVTCFWLHKDRYLWLYCVHSYWCSDATVVRFVTPCRTWLSKFWKEQ
jgi:hypothetical protein